MVTRNGKQRPMYRSFDISVSSFFSFLKGCCSPVRRFYLSSCDIENLAFCINYHCWLCFVFNYCACDCEYSKWGATYNVFIFWYFSLVFVYFLKECCFTSWRFSVRNCSNKNWYYVNLYHHWWYSLNYCIDKGYSKWEAASNVSLLLYISHAILFFLGRLLFSCGNVLSKRLQYWKFGLFV
jgi:hypothetical protein